MEVHIADNIPRWRPLVAEDFRSVDLIADAIHVDLPERLEVFAEKFRLYPRGCFALEQSKKVVGYAVCHTWTLYDIPPLDEFLKELPAQPECLYVHDVAILPQARGHNSALSLIDMLAKRCKQAKIGAMALVSVYGTGPVWGAAGFREEFAPQLQEKLRSYGPTARYMIKRIHI